MLLLGRSALVTGASQGLGKAIAVRLVREGASVTLVARSCDALRAAASELEAVRAQEGQVVRAVAADVASPADCRRAVEAAASLPGFSILINNAAVQGPIGRFEECDWEEWVNTLSVNFIGLARMCREAIPHLRRNGYGKILNLSGGGATGPRPRFSAYAASKAAVVRLTETLAHELADDSIDVNAIAPGAMNTRLLDEVLAAGPEKAGEEAYRQCLKQQATGGTPVDRGTDLVAFLASAASDGITGRLLSAVWDDWATLSDKREALAKTDIFTLRRITPEDRGGLRPCA